MQKPAEAKKATSERLPGREIENEADNPCFGCGPSNGEGLRLRFFDDGEVVRSAFDLDERFSSWEGFANMGVVFTAMMEVGGWALWERLGPSRLDGAFSFEELMPGALGATRIEARVDVAGSKAKIDVTAHQKGNAIARASWAARKATPEEARKVLQFPNLPRSMKGEFEDLARAAKV